jgi:large subunit ribosomal protein L24
MRVRRGDTVQVLSGKNRGMQAGIIDKDMPLPASKVAIICPSCGKPSRIGMREDEAGRKLRICKRCGSDL